MKKTTHRKTFNYKSLPPDLLNFTDYDRVPERGNHP